MADTLLGNINSNYYRSRNVLTGEDNTVKVLVEDELDVPFWKDILGNLVPNKRFSISPYTYNVDGNVENLTKGKAEIIKKAGNGDFSTCYIGCVDSDYDYLLKEYSEDGKIIAECPYLLQTYVYSELKKAISDYFAKQAQKEIDRLWENGELNEEKLITSTNCTNVLHINEYEKLLQ